MVNLIILIILSTLQINKMIRIRISNLLKEEYKLKLLLSFASYLQWHATEIIN